MSRRCGTSASLRLRVLGTSRASQGSDFKGRTQILSKSRYKGGGVLRELWEAFPRSPRLPQGFSRPPRLPQDSRESPKARASSRELPRVSRGSRAFPAAPARLPRVSRGSRASPAAPATRAKGARIRGGNSNFIKIELLRGKAALRVPLLGRSAAIGNATMGSSCGLMQLSG